MLEPAADELTQDAARGLAHVAGVEMQRREAGARRDREQEARTAPEHRPALGQLLIAKQEDAGDQHEHGEQVRRLADKEEREVREPGAGGPHPIRDTRRRRPRH